jgi:hypothetical protein
MTYEFRLPAARVGVPDRDRAQQWQQMPSITRPPGAVDSVKARYGTSLEAFPDSRPRDGQALTSSADETGVRPTR